MSRSQDLGFFWYMTLALRFDSYYMIYQPLKIKTLLCVETSGSCYTWTLSHPRRTVTTKTASHQIMLGI